MATELDLQALCDGEVYMAASRRRYPGRFVLAVRGVMDRESEVVLRDHEVIGIASAFAAMVGPRPNKRVLHSPEGGGTVELWTRDTDAFVLGVTAPGERGSARVRLNADDVLRIAQYAIKMVLESRS